MCPFKLFAYGELHLRRRHGRFFLRTAFSRERKHLAATVSRTVSVRIRLKAVARKTGCQIFQSPACFLKSQSP